MELFPVCNQSAREIVENASSKEEAFTEQETYNLEGNQLEFIFGNDDNATDLVLLEECDHALFGCLNDALKAVAEKKTNAQDFILDAMRKGLIRASNYYTISDEDEEEKKPHYGVVRADQMEDEDFSISYNIELDDDEEFDPDALEFINVNCENSQVSSVIQDKVSLGAAVLNVALYNGKVCFAGHDDYLEDGGFVEPVESRFDIINMDLSAKED